MQPAFSLPPSGCNPSVSGMILRAREAAAVSESLELAELAFAAAKGASSLDIAVASHAVCFYRYRSGMLQSVVDFSTDCIVALSAVDLVEHLTEALRWSALCACEVGDFGRAIELTTEAYRLADARDDLRGRVLCGNILGGIFERSGDPWQGERLMRNSVEMARELDETYPLVTALNNLAAVMIGQFYMTRDSSPESGEARRVLEASLPLVREVVSLAPALGDPFIITLTRGNLGEVLAHLGELDEAMPLLAAVRDEADRAGFVAVSARVRCSIGEALVSRGEFRAATDLLSGLRHSEAITKNTSVQLRLHYALYCAHRALSETEAALVELETFRAIENRRSYNQLRARSELLVTRFEADESQRRGLEHAYEVARSHASRAATLEQMANEDALTGLANRRALDARLAATLDQARAASTKVAVIMIDVDRFKRVNDLYGHAMGDRVLKEVASLLSRTLRSVDFLARTGGEEFLAVLPGADAEEALSVSDRLCSVVLNHSWARFVEGLTVTLSVGVACTPPYDAQPLVECADTAMYQAKQGGRNRVMLAQ